MPHLHLSLQAGNDLVLKRMKRRHTRAEAIQFCRRVRAVRPETAFGADLIAGFPTEDEGMFADTVALVEACDLAYLHVFPYSPRPGTPASRMPQTPQAIARERASRLRAAGRAALGRHLDRRVGSLAQVLVERDGFGRAEDFTPVMLKDVRPGEIATARLAHRSDEALQGERIPAANDAPSVEAIGSEAGIAS